MIYTNSYESPLGSVLLAGDEQGLTGLWFTEGGRYIGLGLKKDACRRETDYFDQTKEWLDIYFSGRDPGFFPQIHLAGSDFRMGKRSHMGRSRNRSQGSAGSGECPHRRSAARSVIIRSASSCHATG